VPSSAFISYSRDDSEFALRLAQDLKEAGAKVWLDQLDIEPGTEWDNAIEEALGVATHILIVLSPASSRSNNVRNEISYGLEQGKIIIPVLYTECMVPLQLQRTQRIDFRADYARGLSSLLRNLQVENPDPTVLQRAAEGDAHRQTAWQAREARKAKELRSRGQSGGATGSTSTPPWWGRRSVQLAAVAALAFVGVMSAIAWNHQAKKPLELYKEAVSDGVRKDYPAAFALYKEACALGDAKSCTAEADMYEAGTGVAKKMSFALALYDKACDAGDLDSCSVLGKRYFNGGDLVQKDPALAVQYDEKACNGGDMTGCGQLGVLYSRGEGVEKDPAKAVELFEKGCEANETLSCSAMGKRYADGDGVPKDMKKAIAFDKRACDAGHGSSCTRLAEIYRSGDGVPEDSTMAKALYQKGCIAGDTKGCDAWTAPPAR
jgi:TPR repeat protein